MFTEKAQRKPVDEVGCCGGKGELHLDMLFSNVEKPANVRVFARAMLVPGDSIGYHVHRGESETYYILSGTGTYNDNGKVFDVKEGDVTVTYSGEGHALENTGDTNLEFIALIALD